MRSFFLFCLSAFSGVVLYAQTRSELWLSAGVKREVFKNIVVNLGSTYRTNYQGEAQTWYQELGVKSEHLDWFRPSIDYRLVTSFDQLRNASTAQRLNLNADFRGKWNEFKFGTRLRAQMYFVNQQTTGGDLDQTYRIKPYVGHQIGKSKVSAQLSCEWFYNPINGPLGHRFNRVRYGASLAIDLPKKNSLELTYYYGRKFNSNNPYSEHLISLDYGFEWKKAKAKKKAN